ncbi:MAG: hypothetical protein ACE5G6_00485 [Terriglobia bacterium]
MIHIRRRSERGASAWQVILVILAVVVLLAALVVLAAVVMVQRFVKIEVSHDNAGAERVAVTTPFGEFTVEESEDAARRLRLPVYPDAEPKDEGVSIRLRGGAGEKEGGLEVVAAEFRTPEPLDRVDAWYREQLGPEFVRETGRVLGTNRTGDIHDPGDWEIRVEPGGDEVLYKYETDNRLRGVVLKREHASTKISLFQVAEARHQ